MPSLRSKTHCAGQTPVVHFPNGWPTRSMNADRQLHLVIHAAERTELRLDQSAQAPATCAALARQARNAAGLSARVARHAALAAAHRHLDCASVGDALNAEAPRPNQVLIETGHS